MTDSLDLRIGHALELLRAMADASVDSIVTDPPYELGFMGKSWDASGIAYSVPLWTEALRVIKPGGHLFAFAATRTYHRMACAVEDAGFEVRDQFAWVYGSGMPKSRDLGDGWGTQAKPAWEPILLARRPFRGTVFDNHAMHGTGGLNIDGCRIEVTDEAYARNCSGDRGHDGTRAAGEGLATNIRTGGGKAAAGRWPANLLHDGSSEVLAYFPTEAGAKGDITGDEPSCASTGIVTNLRERVPFERHGDTGGAARFFYCGKASTAEREAGLEALTATRVGRSHAGAGAAARGEDDAHGKGGYNRVQVRRNIHPTVKPIAVMRWLLRLVTPAGGTTLDLFAGSGTTGMAAILEGFTPILLELDRDDDGPIGYEAIIRARCAWAIAERAREQHAALLAARAAAFVSAQGTMFEPAA